MLWHRRWTLIVNESVKSSLCPHKIGHIRLGMWLTVTHPNSRLLPPPVKYKRLPGLPFRLRGLVVSQLHPSLTHTYIHTYTNTHWTSFGKSYFSKPTNQCWEVRSTVLDSYSRTKLLRYVPLQCYSDINIISGMFLAFPQKSMIK